MKYRTSLLRLAFSNLASSRCTKITTLQIVRNFEKDQNGFKYNLKLLTRQLLLAHLSYDMPEKATGKKKKNAAGIIQARFQLLKK